LTGGSEINPQEAMLESIPSPNPWSAVLETTGHQTPDSASEVEDEDGRSQSAQLVEQGISEAEHDQMLQAARVAGQDDRRDRTSQNRMTSLLIIIPQQPKLIDIASDHGGFKPEAIPERPPTIGGVILNYR